MSARGRWRKFFRITLLASCTLTLRLQLLQDIPMRTAFRTFAAFIGVTTAGLPLAQGPAPISQANPPPAAAAPPAAPEAAKPSDNMEGLAAVYSDKLQGHK